MNLSEEDKKRAILSEHIRELDRQYPSLSFIPNIGQEKAFQFYRSYEDSPYIMLFGGGNGVGKTAALSIFAVGLIFGPDYLDPFFDEFKMFAEYQEILKSRHRKGVVRLVVNADSMREGGSVHQAITEWFPVGKNTKKPLYRLLKGGKTYYSQIEINIPGAPIVEIKTHDQDTVAHSGTTVDWILCDEPFPQQHWTEMLGRTRDGGKIAMFLTPLNMAGWLLDDVVDKVDGTETCMTNASLWENCIDIPGTRGHLTRANIQRMVDAWERANPAEVSARVEGKFTHLTGAIYKSFDEGAHVIEPFSIPPDWPIYNIIDPHDSKPAFCTWILQGPNNQHWVIKEWPTEDFTKLGHTSLTIEKQIQIIRERESAFEDQIVRRIMDPNKGAFTYSNTKRTIQDEWRNFGLRYDLCKIDDLDVGHKAVQRLLWWDQAKPSEPGYNEPMLKYFSTCLNSIKSTKRYGFKKNHDPGASLTAKIDKKYKDPVDNIRYYAVSARDFQTVTDKKAFLQNVYSGRIPLKYK